MTEALQNLRKAWSELNLDCPPYVLEGDQEVFQKHRVPGKKEITVNLDSWEAYIDQGLGHRDDKRLHLGLLPQPWWGDLENARVFILLLNPGLNPIDYFSEYKVPQYREALESNLRGDSSRQFVDLYFNPKYCWHSGADYWHRRLGSLVEKIRKGSYNEALATIARKVCVVQLVPYHSARFNLATRVVQSLPSVALAKKFIQEDATKRNDVLTIVVRGAKFWELKSDTNVITYSSPLARGAYFKKYQNRILEHLNR